MFSSKWPRSRSWLLLAALMCSPIFGCARSSVVPVTANSFAVTTSAAVACGPQGAQQVALETAAIETIRRGHDAFIIMDAAAANNVRVVGTTPVQTSTTASVQGTVYGGYGPYATYSGTGTALSTTTGGQPIYGGSYDQSFLVATFRDGEPGREQAVDARLTLGPDWADKVAKGEPATCL